MAFHRRKQHARHGRGRSARNRRRLQQQMQERELAMDRQVSEYLEEGARQEGMTQEQYLQHCVDRFKPTP